MNKKISILLLLPVFSLASCGDKTWSDGEFKTFNETILVNVEDVKEDKLNSHTALQQAYLDSTWDTIANFADGKKELSLPKGVDLDIPNDKKVYVEVSTSNDFKDSIKYTFEANEDTNIKNLLNNQKYFYRYDFVKDLSSSKINEFTTSDSLPRNLYIKGVTNVRDLGGYKSRLGGRIKQNMYIRGGRLTVGKFAPEAVIKEEGLEVLTKQIGVKTEIDLRRSEEVNFDPENGHMDNSFFKDIEYHSIPMDPRNSENMLDFEPEIKQVFDLLSNEANYPLYLHCSIGTDRTGMISFLLGALLGISIEDLVKDYLFSNFGNIHGSRNEEDPQRYFETLKAFNKENLQLCAEAYLLSIGISQKQINNIKNFMIEK